MAGRTQAATTRPATRSKATTNATPVPSRTTRGAAKVELLIERSNPKTESRKALLNNKENSPDPSLVDQMGKPIRTAVGKNVAGAKVNTIKDTEIDMDREPVKVSLPSRLCSDTPYRIVCRHSFESVLVWETVSLRTRDPTSSLYQTRQCACRTPQRLRLHLAFHPSMVPLSTPSPMYFPLRHSKPISSRRPRFRSYGMSWRVAMACCLLME